MFRGELHDAVKSAEMHRFDLESDGSRRPSDVESCPTEG